MRISQLVATRPLLATVSALVVGALLLTAASGARAEDEGNGPKPDPSLAPEDVVRIQLEALRANDASDRGIEVCFRFASPRNKANTGPVDRFGAMIKQGVYSLMLMYEEAEYQPVEVVERYARQKVTLVGASRIITYVFYLSKQTDASCPDCWMTDSVDVERVLEST